MDLRRYDYPTARVTVTLTGGRSLKQEVTAHRGDSRNPVTQKELHGKFLELSGETLGEERAGKVIELVANLEQLEGIRELTVLLGAP